MKKIKTKRRLFICCVAIPCVACETSTKKKVRRKRCGVSVNQRMGTMWKVSCGEKEALFLSLFFLSLLLFRICHIFLTNRSSSIAGINE